MRGSLGLASVILTLMIAVVIGFQSQNGAGSPAAISTNAVQVGPRPSPTPANQRSAVSITATDTSRPPTATPLPPTATRAQPAQPSFAVDRFASPQTRYTHGLVNLRVGPGTNHDLAGSVSANAKLRVLGESGQWYLLNFNGREVFIAGWLTFDAPPQAVQQQPAPRQQPVQRQQPAPRQQPVQQEQSYTCNCSKTCGQMSSCREAYFQLNNCGCSRRDHDNDGVPCESICS